MCKNVRLAKHAKDRNVEEKRAYVLYGGDGMAYNNTSYFQTSCVGWNMLLCSEGVIFSKQGEIYIFTFSFKETSFHLFCCQLLLHHQWRPPSSQDAAAITAADARFFALISRVVYRIDLSLPQVVTLGKNSRGYHYILANLVSNIQAASRRGSRTCPILHAKGLSHYC